MTRPRLGVSKIIVALLRLLIEEWLGDPRLSIIESGGLTSGRNDLVGPEKAYKVEMTRTR